MKPRYYSIVMSIVFVKSILHFEDRMILIKQKTSFLSSKNFAQS